MITATRSPSTPCEISTTTKECAYIHRLPNDLFSHFLKNYFTPREAYPLRLVDKRFSQRSRQIAQRSQEALWYSHNQQLHLAVVNAVERGAIPLVLWYHERLGHPLFVYYSLHQAAAEKGKLDVLEWLYQKCRPSEQAFVIKAYNEHTDDRLRTMQTQIAASAAKGNQIEALKWALTKGYRWSAEVCAHAAFHGNLEMLEFAHENGCPWNRETCDNAALNGHLEILKYARSHGCPWDEETSASAAQHGHLELLQRLRACNCPWDRRVYRDATIGGHLHVLKWAYANGLPLTLLEVDFCEAHATSRSHHHVVEWLHSIKDLLPLEELSDDS